MKDRKEEMISLCDELLKDIELSRLSLPDLCFKAKRLARLSGDTTYDKAFYYEITGYNFPQGVPNEIFEIACLARRVTSGTNSVNTRSIEHIFLKEKEYTRFIETLDAYDRLKWFPNLAESKQELRQREFFIYDYVVNKNIELKFGSNLESVSDNLVERSAEKVAKYLPDGAKKILSFMENIKSNNHEDWANATTTIRRILESLAKKIESEPDNNKKSDKYYEILKKYIKKEYEEVSKIHMKFIVEDVNEGTHHKATRDDAEKLLLHVCLFLDEIDWGKVNSKNS